MLFTGKEVGQFRGKTFEIEGMDANSGATLLKFNYSTLKDLKGHVPKVIINTAIKTAILLNLN